MLQTSPQYPDQDCSSDAQLYLDWLASPRPHQHQRVPLCGRHPCSTRRHTTRHQQALWKPESVLPVFVQLSLSQQGLSLQGTDFRAAYQVLAATWCMCLLTTVPSSVLAVDLQKGCKNDDLTHVLSVGQDMAISLHSTCVCCCIYSQSTPGNGRLAMLFPWRSQNESLSCSSACGDKNLSEPARNCGPVLFFKTCPNKMRSSASLASLHAAMTSG